MPEKYVSVEKTGLREGPGPKSKLLTELIWGDRVEITGESGDYYEGNARRKSGWVKKSDLGNTGLLEIYVIDVGQGDCVLVRTPEGKWHLIDAGNANSAQMTKKGAANFLRWKFKDDLREPGVTLENVIVTHPDIDHYGGMLNVLSGDPGDKGLFDITVENFYHSGIAKFKESPVLGEKEQGKTGPFPFEVHDVTQKGWFITGLLDGRDSFVSPSRPFASKFQEYAALVGTKPGNVRMLSNRIPYLPGYGPGEGDVTIKVLGPVLETLESGSEGLRSFGDDSLTVNGHSVVLLLVYGKARILLSGDLNEKAQHLLLSYYPAEEFACDVFKACHHGSDDVDPDFLSAVRARATVISSGDNESYSHPKPMLVGACGWYGRESLGKDGKKIAPLVYSTEIARSTALGFAEKTRFMARNKSKPTPVSPENASVKAAKWDDFRTLDKAPISTNLIYGLINVRTDGKHILCATMKESGNEFDCRMFQAGVDAE